MLTRKDFKAIATEIANMADRVAAKQIADFAVTTCKASNPRFDRDRFMAACGLA